jgi:hypothetical protein
MKHGGVFWVKKRVLEITGKGYGVLNIMDGSNLVSVAIYGLNFTYQ